MKSLLLLGLIWTLTWSVLAASDARAEAPKPNVLLIVADDLFSQKIQPLLKSKCLVCHGDDPKKISGSLDMRTRDGLLKGGESGPALVPGNPSKSRLYVAVTRQDENLQMPPKENDRLSAEEIEWLRQWIDTGASWPDAAPTTAGLTSLSKSDSADGVTVATSGGLSPEWSNRRYRPVDIWAYQPIRRPAAPTKILNAASIKNPVDAFIQATLKERGVPQPAPQADKLVLIRRATIDLTGLPPRPDEIEVFLTDESPEAFEKVVARLLKSPHYGEQQTRHWLDVVRYADTSGFSNDYERPNAWRYRDYVIRSFNHDKPFDRFLVEQLAGDELDPDDPEMLIAVGFLRMGPWEHTGMTVAAVTRQQYLDDITHSVGVAFLGQGLRCARCHDHKVDPVPTRDYYRIQSVFAATQFVERKQPFLPHENVPENTDTRAGVERRLNETKRILAELNKKNKDAIEAFLTQKGVNDFADLPRDGRENKAEIGLTKEELSIRKVQQKRQDYFERELNRFEPHAFSVYSGPPNQYSSPRPLYDLPANRDGAVPAVHILTGGSIESPVDAVKPGVLSAMFGSNDAEQPAAWNTIPDTTGGRRLAFARWVASPNNTLTARVIVNRIWQQHFGRGLVATPNNFGKMGGRPTHPELLDWLATWFIEHGWSIKKLHALIMTSATYQQSGVHPEMKKLRELDSNNELLAHFPPRRLAAEEIRDALLAVTGELNVEMGGPGVFPEINWEVAFQPRHIMGSVAPAYQPSPTPRQRNRRTVYAFRYRTLADPMLEVFNRPGSETSCERRDESTVTPQVFSLFHSEFVNNRALALAASVEKRAETVSDQITLAFRLAYGRSPTAGELQSCSEHVAQLTKHHRQHSPQPTKLPTSVRRHMVEEMTGEDISWEEDLDVLKDYNRDLMPWQVGPETRGLAELCLVLINSNEFLYVR